MSRKARKKARQEQTIDFFEQTKRESKKEREKEKERGKTETREQKRSAHSLSLWNKII